MATAIAIRIMSRLSQLTTGMRAPEWAGAVRTGSYALDES
jgi:hypothetical protein